MLAGFRHTPRNRHIASAAATALQKTAGGILLPSGPPKTNSDAHVGEVRPHASPWGWPPPCVPPPRLLPRPRLPYTALAMPSLNGTPFCAGSLPSHPPPAPTTAQVISVGESVSLPVKVGDKVIYNKYAMAEVEVPDGDIIFVAEKSILATLS